MSSKKQIAKPQNDSIGSDANRQPQFNMVDASLLLDYIATLKELLEGKDEQIRMQNEQIRMQNELMCLLIDKYKERSEQYTESTSRSNGKHLLS